MTDNKVFQLAEKFRSAILRANVNGEFFRDRVIELFPRGNCGIVCNLLGRYFLEYADVRSWYTFGATKSESHVWLTLENGSIVDATGDQYSNRTGVLHYDLSVYVGQIDALWENASLFLAKTAKTSAQHLDEFERMDAFEVEMETAVEMVMDGRIRCNSSAHAILMAARMMGI